jgi:hypothetical protein
MKRTYHGSCHCGAVRFECELDLAEGTSKCNCSICTKTRFWKAIVKADSFRLLRGEDVLVDYQFGSGFIHHLFCGRCGVKTFGRGEMEELGGRFYAVNVACLDDATDEELALAPIAYENGRSDRWDQAPAETSYL